VLQLRASNAATRASRLSFRILERRGERPQNVHRLRAKSLPADEAESHDNPSWRCALRTCTPGEERGQWEQKHEPDSHLQATTATSMYIHLHVICACTDLQTLTTHARDAQEAETPNFSQHAQHNITCAPGMITVIRQQQGHESGHARVLTRAHTATSKHLRYQNDEEDAEERITRAPLHMREHKRASHEQRVSCRHILQSQCHVPAHIPIWDHKSVLRDFEPAAAAAPAPASALGTDARSKHTTRRHNPHQYFQEHKQTSGES